MKVSRKMLLAMAKAAAKEHGKPVVVVAEGDEATSCCGAWHEISESHRTVCKSCFRSVDAIYLKHEAEVKVWEIPFESLAKAGERDR